MPANETDGTSTKKRLPRTLTIKMTEADGAGPGAHLQITSGMGDVAVAEAADVLYNMLGNMMRAMIAGQGAMKIPAASIIEVPGPSASFRH